MRAAVVETFNQVHTLSERVRFLENRLDVVSAENRKIRLEFTVVCDLLDQMVDRFGGTSMERNDLRHFIAKLRLEHGADLEEVR